ncbi:MAG: CPXCG motif-containing cysteine-rich protein [Woeseiaceae bacterium]
MDLLERKIDCPYCGESLDVLVDMSEVGQSYVEDCQVCCRPIVFNVSEDIDGDTQLVVTAENE